MYVVIILEEAYEDLRNIVAYIAGQSARQSDNKALFTGGYSGAPALLKQPGNASKDKLPDKVMQELRLHSTQMHEEVARVTDYAGRLVGVGESLKGFAATTASLYLLVSGVIGALITLAVQHWVLKLW
jgi:hypothetical protein